MKVSELVDELDYASHCDPIQVEIDGVVHDIHSVKEDSQGFYLVVDTDQEERKMR